MLLGHIRSSTLIVHSVLHGVQAGVKAQVLPSQRMRHLHQEDGGQDLQVLDVRRNRLPGPRLQGRGVKEKGAQVEERPLHRTAAQVFPLQRGSQAGGEHALLLGPSL